ncbi:MAG: hypothetical protein ABJN40_16070 [Sneathiella sp.]
MMNQTLTSVAALTAAILIAGTAGTAIAAGGAKTTFERSKPHVNVLQAQPEQRKATRHKTPGGLTAKPFVDLEPKAKYPVGALPGAPMSGFCGPNQGGGVAKYVTVGVKNNGTKPGGTFINRVTFPDALPAERVQEDPYQNSGPGFGTAYIGFKIPASAWKNGKAKFVIKVDAKLDVKETKENNNIATGYCVEPAS